MTTEILSNKQEFFLTTKTGAYITTHNGEYILVKGGSVIARISEFVFTEQDMGDAVITCDVKYPAEEDPQFSLDWCITYKGEKFFLSTLQPPCLKDNTSLLYKYSLTFRSERDDLKRYDMLDLVKSEEGDDIANRYSFAFDADIRAFADRFNANLAYNFGSRWKMVLAKDLTSERVTVSCIDGVKLWDLLQQVYELYGVRWRISSEDKTPTTDAQMVIHVGEDPIEISHVFEYDPDKDDQGVTGGLYSIERVNPLDPIFTRMRGLGGTRNIPYRYFKAQSKVPSESQYPADPDYNPALSTSLFNNLMPKCFRDYWKGYNGTLPAIDSYAYKQGVADKAAGKPNPVDYALSDKEAKWGVRYGALQPNEDIYPTIQGVWDAKLGRIDEVVAVSEVVSDTSTDYAPNNGNATGVFDELDSVKVRAKELEYQGVKHGTKSTIVKNFNVDEGDTVRFYVSAVWQNEANVDNGSIGSQKIKIKITSVSLMGTPVGGGVYKDTQEVSVVNPKAYEVKFSNLKKLSRAYFVINYEITSDESIWYTRPPAHVEHYMYPEFYDWGVFLHLYNCMRISASDTPSTEQPSYDPDKLGDRGFYIWIKDIGFDIRKPEYWAVNQGDMSVMFSDGLLAGEDYEFPIAAEKSGDKYTKIYFTEDTTKSIDTVNEQGEPITVPSKWRIGLVRSDVEFEASGKLIPNTHINTKAGDHFFLVNIQLPQKYVEWAEQRLQNYIEAELAKVDDENPTFAIKPDQIFCANFAEADLIRAGARIHIRNQRLIGAGDLPLYITSLSLTHTADKNLPAWDIVVSETPSVAMDSISLLQGSVEALSRSILPSSEIIRLATLELDRIFLRSDGMSDTSYSPTTFEERVRMGAELISKNFTQNIFGGAGWGIYKDVNGNSVFEIDKINVRKELHTNKATVNQIELLSGRQIYSRGGIVVTDVEKLVDAYKLFFDIEQGDKFNPFVVGDQAYADNFNSADLTTIKYYWALVTDVGEDYIVISASDKDGEGIPAVGDNVAQLGNRSDPSRQSALVIDQISGGMVIQYAQLGDPGAIGGEWSFEDRAFVGYGYDPVTAEAKWFTYGDAYIGDRDIDDPQSTFVTFQRRKGDTRRRLHIKGDVELGAGSTGLSNMTEFTEYKQQVDENTANTNALKIDLENVKNQVDGAIETWFLEPVPTLGNPPASSWDTTELRNQHLGDLYYDGSGKVYRFELRDNVYRWKFIPDTDVTKALENAKKAQDTADVKRRVFVNTPNNASEYDVGDLWVNATYGKFNNDLLRCKTPKIAGDPWDISHWEKATNYTDDTLAQDALQKITDVEYLRQVFPNQVLNNSGVSLAQLLAVKDGADNIVAGMYGGGVEALNTSGYKDPTHGTLMIFAGAENAQSVAAAKTRIYEDGELFTNKLNANGGLIGGYTIDDRGFHRVFGVNKMSLSEFNLSFDETGRNTSSLSLGANVYSISSGIRASILIQNVAEGQTFTKNYGISISCKGGKDILNAEPSYGNHALNITNGVICGLRCKTRVVNKSTVLTGMDTVVYANTNNGEIWLKFPTDAENGQMCVLKDIGNRPMWVEVGDMNTHYIRWNSGLHRSLKFTDNNTHIFFWNELKKVWEA